MPIKKYKIVQTGAKSQFGGLKGGLIKKAYQVGIFGVVKNAPIIPADSQRIIAIIKRKKLGINKILTDVFKKCQ